MYRLISFTCIPSIGHKTRDDPYTVQLNFTPAGTSGTEDHALNICVVCGNDESYMRKSVVPHDYRRHFPPFMKDHHSHDILLTCLQCHSRANSFDDQLRKELAIQYNAPLGMFMYFVMSAECYISRNLSKGDDNDNARKQ